MIQRHPWECNLFWLSVSPIFSRPFYNPNLPPFPHPSIRVIDFYGNKASASHKIAHPWWRSTCLHLVFPSPLPCPLDFKGGGGLKVELTSRPGMIDISLKDTETQSVTDISIIEISHYWLPSDRGRATFCSVEGDGNWGKNWNAIDIYHTIKSVTSRCLSPSLPCGGCTIIICMAEINLLHRPCGAPLVTPLQSEVNMWDAMDDPLWRSDVRLRNPFSIQSGEWKRNKTGTEKRWVECSGGKESPWKQVMKMRARTSTGICHRMMPCITIIEIVYAVICMCGKQWAQGL